MRVLIASDHYPPHIGGAQIQTRLLAISLTERGHDVAVATMWQRDVASFDDDDGFPVYRIREATSCVPKRFQRAFHHHPPYPDPITTVMLRRLIKRFKPDLVHSHGWFTYSCALALLGTDIPLAISARDTGYSCATRTMLHMGRVPCSGPAPSKCLHCATEYYGQGKGWLAVLGVRAGRPLLRRKIAAVHSVSRYVQEVVRRDLFGEGQNGPESSHPLDIAEGVIPELVRSSPRTEGIAGELCDRLAELPSEPFILFVGALRREKGVYELLSAYRRLRSPPPLVLIGGGDPNVPHKPLILLDLPGDTHDTLPEGVVVVPNLPHAGVPRAWEHALFGVMPSRWPEPLGTVVCEAMSCGRAVIGTDHGGHPDLITHGVNGLLVPPGDVVALADAMRLLLEEPAERHRLGTAARVVGRRFAADQAVERFEDLYRDALAR
jgi:glycosyltransferase involved in cell wall biosynthesis